MRPLSLSSLPPEVSLSPGPGSSSSTVMKRKTGMGLCSLPSYPESLERLFFCFISSSQMARSQVNHPIPYYLSQKTPFKLQMMLLDTAAKEECEILDLTRSRDPVKEQYRSILARDGNCIKFHLSSSRKLEDAMSELICTRRRQSNPDAR